MNLRYLTSFILIIATLSILYLSFNKYKTESTTASETSASSNVGSKNSDEVGLLFQENKLTPSRYSIIADKNIFSKDRKAWAPPPPKKITPPPKKATPVVPVKPPDPIKPEDLALYGTYVTKGENHAIIQFNRFLGKRKRKVVKQGEVVRDDNKANESIFYTIKSITPAGVVVEDNLKREITLDLFAARKKTGDSYALRNMDAKSKEKLAAQGILNKVSTPFGNTYKNPSETDSKRKKLIDKYKKKYPEKEKLVEQGKLKRIITPFGPSYRKVK